MYYIHYLAAGQAPGDLADLNLIGSGIDLEDLRIVRPLFHRYSDMYPLPPIWACPRAKPIVMPTRPILAADGLSAIEAFGPTQMLPASPLALNALK
jgi:hypothetical protein